METNKQHKLRHRLTAVGITAGVVAAVLLLNLAFTLLCNRFLLRIDMTTEKFNEISSDSSKLLDELDPAENNIIIYFLADPDELNSPALGYSNSYYTDKGYDEPVNNLWGMKYVYELAEEFADRYDFVRVETLNLRRDADFLEQFRSTLGTELTRQDVIIDNYTGEHDGDGNPITDQNGEPIMHHNFRIVKRDAFFAFDSETSYVYAFKGDERFTSTILSLSGANPTVYFVSGHGEKVGAYQPGDSTADGDYGEAQGLRDLFFDAGFSTRKINLSAEYETLFNDPTARIVVIYGPAQDYTGDDAYVSGGISEIAALRRFMVNPNHHMMAFLDQTEAPLSNLEEYLCDYWGVNFGDGLVKDNGENSLGKDGLSFIGEYETNKYSIGINLINQMDTLDSRPLTAFENARPITLSPNLSQSTGYYESYASVMAGGVLYAPDSAASGAQNAEGEPVSGEMLMSLSYEVMRDSNNNEHSTYVLSCGSTGFASTETLNDTAYGNRDVLYYAMRLMGRETVLFDLDFKVVQSEGLDSITESQAIGWTIVLCSLIPLGMLITGTVVYVKRRHS